MLKLKLNVSAEGVPPEHLSGFWSDVFSKLDLDAFVVVPRHPFGTTMRLYDFGKTNLIYWDSVIGEIDRTHKHCIQKDNSLYSLCFIRKGHLTIKQSGRSALVKQGGCVLLELAKPFFMGLPTTTDLFIVRMPTDALCNRISFPQDITAIPFSQDFRRSRVLLALMATLAEEFPAQTALTPHELIELIVGSLALALGVPKEAVNEYQAKMLQRFRVSLRELFQDPQCSPSSLAMMQGVSKRTVHSVFASAGSSFGAELKSLRMNQARQHLNDPKFDGKTIAEIGRLVGFVHSTYFITQFRRIYGVTPFVYRSVRE